MLGDIHSNLSALEATLAALTEEGVDHVLSVGDVVGYGAHPRPCIDLLRAREVVVVKGNHDAACVGELDLRLFNDHARKAVEWTRDLLGREEKRWLAELPYTVDLEDCSVGHGTYHAPEKFEYVLSTTDADPSLDVMPREMCFVGHTHVPVTLLRLRDDPSVTAYTLEPEVDLSLCARTLMNVGSVGQPRDEDPRAAYAVFDASERRAWLRRVEYDIDREAQAILAAGLPSVLAERLYLGV